ncbi:MAG: alpha/beta hydrolase [Chloroflexia bacterium]|nr:alpha/beta hydrolase [Chloroflexia bacterium]
MIVSDEKVSIPQWRYAPDAWRWVKRFDERYAASVLRFRSAGILPQSMRARFLAMGIHADILESTLASIKSPEGWANAWIETAQRFLGDYRRQVSAKQLLEAAQARRLAALSYHCAQLLAANDTRTVRTCRAAAASLFAQAQPYLYPNARRLMIPWRTYMLTGYLQSPVGAPSRSGLVVVLNGSNSSKEESFDWAASFLRAGLSVLSLDIPGTGESSSVPVSAHDEDDLLDGVFEVMRHEPGVDLAQISVVGVSVGGNLAVRCAAYDRRLMSSVAVTPPFDPARWIGHGSPFLLRQLDDFSAGTAAGASTNMNHYSLHDVAPEMKSPLLVFGAGHDLIVSPTESQLLAARAGAIGTLIWYPESGHGLYDSIPSWTAEAATWISSVAAARAMEYQNTGFADPVQVAILAREQLLAAGAMDDDFFDDEGSARLIELDDTPEPDDAGSYARMVTPPPRPEPSSNHAT